MNTSPTYTNSHSFVADEFNRVRMKARRSSLIAKIFGTKNGLEYLSENSLAGQQNKVYAGIQNIPTDKIVGTVSRIDDFDKDFRPLKKHLQQRWVNMFILHGSDSWRPIRVHKVCDGYFVEDGHHRVSVAKMTGMLFIEAEVWDHSSRPVQPCAGRLPGLLKTSRATAGAAD
jgi:hypothetical protein